MKKIIHWTYLGLLVAYTVPLLVVVFFLMIPHLIYEPLTRWTIRDRAEKKARLVLMSDHLYRLSKNLVGAAVSQLKV